MKSVNNTIVIDGRTIGHGHKTFLIAEAGVNHNGDVGMAEDLIRAASRSGADCVKFQTFRAERVVTATAPKARYQILVTDPAESQIDMLRKLELSENAYGDLIDLCRREGIVFTSTPYNEEDVDFLIELDVPLFKAASIHLAEPRFLMRMAETGRPLIVSTGMATWDELTLAVDAIRSTGNNNYVLLQCTTNYPASIEDTNLNAMVAMRERFGCLTGYSDHTPSHVSCLGAVALGACMIEKHFTLDKLLPGPDHTTSETPEEFAALVREVRLMEAALGSSNKAPTAAEQANMQGMRRSIVARRRIAAGQVVSDGDLTCKRPATGIAPREWNALVGKRAIRDIEAGSMVTWGDLDG
jgi:N-acetylneuraminate synthase/N,N'-diacetyllegionaminate synthase